MTNHVRYTHFTLDLYELVGNPSSFLLLLKGNMPGKFNGVI